MEVRKTTGLAIVMALVAIAPGSLRAQADGARIVGRILDAQTARPLVSAQVYLADGSVGALTAVDGRYMLRGLPAGGHDVVVELIGYASKTITGVVVAAGETVTLDVALSTAAIEMDAIVVTAAAERGSSSALLGERRVAPVVSDAIGAEQISRSPDGDAAAALKRVPGLSVVDGRYAYVRGLGERYGATTLNGAPLASPMPDKKVIPLDVIPSGLLESIVTSKSFSPDQPGDHAGGLVQLRTRTFPTQQILSASVSGGWISNSSFQEGLGYHGGSRDFLGFDDGTRGLPDMIPRDRALSRSNFSPDELQSMGRAFNGEWGPTTRSLPPQGGMSISFGQDFDLSDDRRLGIVASGNYSSKYTVQSNLVERVFSQAGAADPEVDYRGEVSERSVSLGGLVSATFQPRASDQLTLMTVYTRLTDDAARELEGYNIDSNTNQWNSRLQYLAQSLLNTQLRGEHALGFLGDTRLEWRGAYTRASRYEPGTREALYREFNGQYYWDDFIQSGSVFHQDMVDAGWSGGARLEVPFRLSDLPASASFGASTDRKDRAVYTRRFRFRPQSGGVVDSDARTLAPNQLFTDAYIRPDGFEIQEATFRTDNYDGSNQVDAAFAMLEAEPIDRLRLSGGARLERTLQSATPKDLWNVGLAPVEGAELEATDVLPALNATLELTTSMNLRAGVSRTLARPQLRELAPFSFADYAGGYLVIGNPLLDRTRIQNYDLRWEWFAGPRAVVAVSGFYKRFRDPIEVSVLPSTELLKTWVNADGAENRGVELEVRSDLGFASGSLAAVEVSGNLTLVTSEVTTGSRIDVYLPGTGATSLSVVEKNRALQGQSPYVANLGLAWAPQSGVSAGVLFNRFGRRIDAVGGQATPDVFEEARSQLDVVLEWPVTSGWKAKATLGRLMGNEVEFTQGGETLRSYELGRTVSFSLSWGSGL